MLVYLLLVLVNLLIVFVLVYLLLVLVLVNLLIVLVNLVLVLVLVNLLLVTNCSSAMGESGGIADDSLHQHCTKKDRVQKYENTNKKYKIHNTKNTKYIIQKIQNT